jgi:hypothetical protein
MQEALMPSRVRFRSALVIVACVMTAAFVSGCSSELPASRFASDETSPIDRKTAVEVAKTDAVRRYSGVRIANVDVVRMDTAWIIELQDQSGTGLRYAISARDGSIRERRVFQ